MPGLGAGDLRKGGVLGHSGLALPLVSLEGVRGPTTMRPHPVRTRSSLHGPLTCLTLLAVVLSGCVGSPARSRRSVERLAP